VNNNPSITNGMCRLHLPVILVSVLLAGCAVGPDYHRPSALPAHPMPSSFGDAAVANAGNWKIAEPSAHLPRGAWWEIYDDRELNRLESLAAENNQQVAIALANYEQARASVSGARADFFPQVSGSANATRQRTSANASPTSATAGKSTAFAMFGVSGNGWRAAPISPLPNVGWPRLTPRLVWRRQPFIRECF
jgi:outer membrane protein TolC